MVRRLIPPALLADRKSPAFYREWLDSFFARDIQRLFAIRDMNRFNALFEYMLRPFHGGGRKEIVRMPRVYGFDTGFVSFARGWDPPRTEDYGFLWEHLVLEHLQAHLPDVPLHYWRDKAGREVDFVIVRDRDEVDAIECKWDPTQFDPAGLKTFRSWYPKGDNYLVCPLSVPAYVKRQDNLMIKVCDPVGIGSATN